MEGKKAIKVSIIIPVWNVSKYLRRCLDSCIYQTLDNIEIIVVNDCSPDLNDSIIMKEYKAAYPNKIRCFWHNENLCLGGARNTGIENANGEYIAFVDSDDYISHDMCEKLYKRARAGCFDIMLFPYYLCSKGNIRLISGYSERIDYSNKNHVIVETKSHVSWSYFYKATFLKSNKALRFPEHILHEDVPFMVMCWALSKRLGIYIDENPKAFYYWVKRAGSVTESPSIRYYHNYIEGLWILDSFKNNYEGETKYAIAAHILGCLCSMTYGYFLNPQTISFADEIRLAFIKFINEYTSDFDKMPIDEVTLHRFKRIKELAHNTKNVHEFQKLLPIGNRYIKCVETVQEYVVRYNVHNICVWGCGEIGSLLIEEFSRHNIKIRAVDANKTIWGKKISGDVIVEHWDVVKSDINIVISCVGKFTSEIRKIVLEYDKAIIFINVSDFHDDSIYYVPKDLK